MKALSERVQRVARALAWQAVGFTIILILLAVGLYRAETAAQDAETAAKDVQGLRPRVAQIIESVEVCQAGASKAELRTCVRRIEVALRRCRQKPSCRAEFRAVLSPPRGGGASQPSSTGGQQPGPRGGGDTERRVEATPGPTKVPPKSRKPRPRATSPLSPTGHDPAPTSAPPPPPALPVPGKAGETPGADKGTKACVELILSACVRASTDD